MLMLAAVVIVLVALVISWWREPRRLRNGVLLVTLVVLALLTGAIEGPQPIRTICVVIVIGSLVLLPVATLITGVVLVGNGVVMVQHERPSPGNALSALTGLLLLAVLAAATIAATQVEDTVVLGVVATAVVVVGYLSLVFVSFSAYSLLYALRRRTRPVDGIVVLGAGLVDGDVPPLLEARLERGLRLYREHGARGWPSPALVPSGGRGPDEPLAEGIAMARWLHEHGVPARDVLPETKASTTEENLTLGARVLAEHDRGARIAVVTNTYHSFRAALLARHLRLDAETFGARTAAYFVPSAYLREFVAVLRMHLGWHVVAIGSLTLVMALLTWASVRGG
ncbi:MAG: YdcF family protein [Patulibacter sp.]